LSADQTLLKLIPSAAVDWRSFDWPLDALAANFFVWDELITSVLSWHACDEDGAAMFSMCMARVETALHRR
jgi:hypothetical protein